MNMKRKTSTRGFTLVEMIVAVGLFAVVMMVSVSALLALVNANRKAQALQSVMNNLNVAIDGMVRSIRMGSQYHCGASGVYTATADCSSGDTLFAFEPFHSGADAVPPWVYWFAEDQNGVGRLYKSEDGTLTGGVAMTAPEVSVDSVRFYVIGSSRGDSVQPKVLIIIKGTAGNTKITTQSTFHIQATAVQRILDL
jgi:prepilin-type N-terminal cleavage/methylation domain-containing protein